jgi:hypothetical protein
MAAFAETDLALLRRLAGRVIPASGAYSAPGADDDAIFATVVQALEHRAAAILAMLAKLDAASLASAPAAQVDEEIRTLLGADPAMGEVVAAVIQCYYLDDRVMRSLGLEPRSPFPQGFEVEQGDWSLLDPVRARPKIWRDAP